jgi:hypothetical protein
MTTDDRRRQTRPLHPPLYKRRNWSEEEIEEIDQRKKFK